ncbi:MAG: NYN domain-containing protein [Candidatus Melainabacteria bacterium]|jgi:uncharacterized LabA/DUF88 family protein
MKIIYAFIDSQNLNLAVRDQGWKIDFQRFRVYLQDKYKVKQIFLFIGYVPGNEALYTKLQKAGYIIIFKPTLEIDGKIKGNVDAELVLHAMIEFENYDKAIIVSGDGDFHCLIEYLLEKDKLDRVLIPNRKKYSVLLRKFRSNFDYMNNLKEKLQIKRRRVTQD